jgi:hypothetical protein
LRFSDADVRRTLAGVLRRIQEIAQARLCAKVIEESATTPLPNPPPQGGREPAAVPARIGNKAVVQ